MDFMVKSSTRRGFSLMAADFVWAIYQLVIDIVPPMPSADYLWLCAYGFLGYYLFSTYKEFQKKFNFGRKVLVASVIGKAIFLRYIIAFMFYLVQVIQKTIAFQYVLIGIRTTLCDEE
jgi:hypothetical protein